MNSGPCEIWFYHLERSTLDQTLPELLEKTLARGWRAAVRSSQAERIDHLDGWLWSYRDDSFLPHGLADEPLADRQPILLTTAMETPNAADVLFLLDGADPGPLEGHVRCVVMFDGRDEAALALARTRWTAFKAASHPVSYWRQGAERGWEKQA